MDITNTLKSFVAQKILGLNVEFKNHTFKNSMLQNETLNLFGNNVEASIKNGYLSNHIVYSCINKITQPASRAKVDVIRTARGESEQVEDHKFLKLLKRPNPLQGQNEFLENAIGFYSITGESFIHFIKAESGINRGLPVEMWVINPVFCKSIKRDSHNIPISYEFGSGSTKIVIPAEEIIHLKSFNPDPDSGRGLSPIQASKFLIQQSNNSYKANAKLLQNSMPLGILTKSSGENTNLSPENAGKLEAKFYEKYGGVNNYGRIVITNASMNWQKIGLSPVDLNIIESQKMGKKDIAMVYDVPAVLIGDNDGAKYDNVNIARKDLILNNVVPKLERLFSAIDRQILSLYEAQESGNVNYTFKLDLSVYPEIQEDLVVLADTLSKSWWLTPNERRAKMNLPKMDDESMNIVYAPTGVIPIDMAGTDSII